MKRRKIILISIASVMVTWLVFIFVVRQLNVRALEQDRAALEAAGVTMSWEDVDLPPDMDSATLIAWQRWQAKPSIIF